MTSGLFGKKRLIHRVSVAVDLGDAGQALSLAPTVDASELSVSRYPRHLIDVAMAHNYRRDNEQMVGTLLRVERIAPEQLTHFPLVRELLHAALRRGRKGATRAATRAPGPRPPPRPARGGGSPR